MNKNIYFFDSYAIIEILLGNDNYRKYLDKYVILTKLNLFEIFYSVLRDFDEEKANEVFSKYYLSIVDYSEDIIKEAARFRLGYKKRDFSMTDCIGYIIAKRLKIRFLTGDKEFENLDNVEFVK